MDVLQQYSSSDDGAETASERSAPCCAAKLEKGCRICESLITVIILQEEAFQEKEIGWR